MSSDPSPISEQRAKPVTTPSVPDPNTAAITQMVNTLQNAPSTFNVANATSMDNGNGGRITLVDDPTFTS